MIRRIIGAVSLLLLSMVSNAQKPDPVHFSYSAKKINDRNYEFHITATMEDGWHIYAQQQPKEAIAIPSKITFVKNPLVRMNGLPKETGSKETYEDKNAGITQYQYGGTLDFTQTITLKAAVKTKISGTITYQACTGEMCLPAKTVTFSIPVE